MRARCGSGVQKTITCHILDSAAGIFNNAGLFSEMKRGSSSRDGSELQMRGVGYRGALDFLSGG